MAIRREVVVNEYGTEVVRTSSDKGMMIRRNDGVVYDIANDKVGSNYTYIETDIPIEDETTEADKDAALRRFGVEVTND